MHNQHNYDYCENTYKTRHFGSGDHVSNISKEQTSNNLKIIEMVLDKKSEQ